MKYYTKLTGILLGFMIAWPLAAQAEYFDYMRKGRAVNIASGGMYLRNDKLENMILNPAAISNIARKEVAGGVSFFENDKINSFFSYVHPTLRGVGGAEFSYLEKDSEQEDFLASALLGYSLPILNGKSQKGSAGINVKAIHDKEGDEEVTKVASDAGFTYALSRSLTLGMALTNIGGNYEIGGRKNRLPLGFNLNLQKELNDVSIGVSYDTLNSAPSVFRVGLEHRATGNVFLRGGYLINSEGENKKSAGLAFNLKGLTFNYAALIEQQGGSVIHSLSAGLKFGAEIPMDKRKLSDIERFYSRGEERFYEGDLAGARESFLKVSQIDPAYRNTREFLTEITKALAMLRQSQVSKEKLQEIIELMQQAELFFETGDYEAAIQYYAAVLMIDQENEEAQKRIEEIKEAERQKEKEEARKDRQKRIQEASRRLQNYYDRGRESYNRGNHEQAMELYNQGINYARVQGMREWRVKLAAALEDVRETLSERYFNEGHKHYQRNEFREALDKFRKVLEYNPERDEAKNRIEELEARIERMDREEAEELYNQGLEAYNNENYSRAEDYFTRALELNPKHIEAQRALERVQNME
ncbi:MAG: tetratricopeptide repeat protein [Elusimicrobiota bacterium]